MDKVGKVSRIINRERFKEMSAMPELRVRLFEEMKFSPEQFALNFLKRKKCE